nr:hypothetical protein BaRGS_023989 [Batillaria attramentaria]
MDQSLEEHVNGIRRTLPSVPSKQSDGLLSQEREDLVERVAYLEKKVTQQEDEIVCLKSALADVIRRLAAVENASQNSVLPSKPSFRPTPRRSIADRKTHLSALDNVNMAGASHRNSAPPGSLRSPRSAASHSSSSAASSQQLKKWASLSNSAEMSNSQLTPNKQYTDRHGRLFSSKDPVWSQEEASLKIYLKGRAVNLYAPSSVTDYNVAKPGELPTEKLQLEWVYGYRGRDCRSNLYYLPTGEIIYFTAAVVVLYNVEEQTQRHYLGHTDDVKWVNRITQAVVGAHEGGVFSLCGTKDGNLLSGGGKDRKVIEWDSGYSKTGRETEVAEVYGPVRTLNQGKGGLILIGTTKNCILQGSLDLEFSPVMQSHLDELWGLAAHPSQHQFLTCGADRHVYLWDSQSRSVVWLRELNDPAHSCCFHPEGNVAAIGTQAARWVVLDLATHEIVSVHTDGNEQIECVQYSPDGAYLAVGSRDNYIYVYQVTDGGRKYSRVGRCSGHSSFITHLDWSEDSQYLASNSGDYELLYWAASTCKQVTNHSAVRDVAWATQNCTLAFTAAGIWPEGADGTDVNNCCRNHKQTLLATADDFGKVNLFKYPCSQPRSPYHSFKGHSSHVTSVAFLFDDSRLVSTGGHDMAILQWQVV